MLEACWCQMLTPVVAITLCGLQSSELQQELVSQQRALQELTQAHQAEVAELMVQQEQLAQQVKLSSLEYSIRVLPNLSTSAAYTI